LALTTQGTFFFSCGLGNECEGTTMSKKQIVRKHEREQLQKQSRMQRKKDKTGAAEPNKTNRDNLEPKKRTQP
jgi:hypothetical protein